jgi:hypothetical protein
MSNRLIAKYGRYFVAETYVGPKPGDFPVGSLQSRAAARAILAAYAEEQRKMEADILGNLTPQEQATIEGAESPAVQIWMLRILRVAQERAIVYEQPLPMVTPEQIRRNRAIYEEINRMTFGKAQSINLSNSIEWNRLKAIAEENLRAKKK